VAAGSQAGLRASDVLKRAQELDPATFDKWRDRGVAGALKRYGLRTLKTHGRKTYARVTLDAIRRIESAYGLDLGLPE
jgi:hypothetical protein